MDGRLIMWMVELRAEMERETQARNPAPMQGIYWPDMGPKKREGKFEGSKKYVK